MWVAAQQRCDVMPLKSTQVSCHVQKCLCVPRINRTLTLSSASALSSNSPDRELSKRTLQLATNCWCWYQLTAWRQARFDAAVRSTKNMPQLKVNARFFAFICPRFFCRVLELGWGNEESQCAPAHAQNRHHRACTNSQRPSTLLFGEHQASSKRFEGGPAFVVFFTIPHAIGLYSPIYYA